MGAWQVVVDYVAPLVGVVVANAMFSSPLAAVLRVRRMQDLGDLNPLPYPVIFVNCISWLVYAMLTRDWFLYFGNLPGMLLGIFFVLSTIKLAPPQMRRDTEILQLALLFEVAGVAGGLALWGVKRSVFEFVWGLNCNIILLIYYGAPLSKIVHVFRSRSSSVLHLPMVLANFINGTMWFVYGLWGLKDYWLWGVNGMGAILAAFQLTLLLVFPRTTRIPIVSSPQTMAQIDSLTPIAAAGVASLGSSVQSAQDKTEVSLPTEV